MIKKSSLKKIDFKEALWKAADKLRNQMDAAEYKHIVLGLIFVKYISDTFDTQKEKIKKMISNKKSDFFISDDPKIYEKELEDRDYYTQDNVFWVPKKARWEKIRAQAKQPDIGSIIDKALIEIENENKSLRNKLDKRFGRTQLDEGKLGELIDLISKIGFSNEQNSVDLLGEVYEYFLGQFASAEGKKAGQYYTPSSIVKTLVSILSPFKGRIYDPCCGSGGMFVQSQQFIKSHGGKLDDVSIYGQESNPTTWRLAAMNLAIRGFSVDLGKSNGDTFGKDQFPDKKFNYILANPPFNVSDWEGEKFENDVRWKYGRPPIGNANYAWLQHIFWKLNDGGQAGIVLANGSLSSDSSGEDDIRKKMLEDDIIDAIVSLPEKLFLNTQIPCCLWILSKNKNEINRRNETLFIDASNLGIMKTRKLRIFNDQDINKIANTYTSWRKDENYRDVLGFCKSIKLDEIQKGDHILNPGRYVGFINEKKDNITFSEKIKNLTKEYYEISSEGENLRKNIEKSLKKIMDVK